MCSQLCRMLFFTKMGSADGTCAVLVVSPAGKVSLPYIKVLEVPHHPVVSPYAGNVFVAITADAIDQMIKVRYINSIWCLQVQHILKSLNAAKFLGISEPFEKQLSMHNGQLISCILPSVNGGSRHIKAIWWDHQCVARIWSIPMRTVHLHSNGSQIPSQLMHIETTVVIISRPDVASCWKSTVKSILKPCFSTWLLHRWRSSATCILAWV